jgi:uncharacterized protein YcbX
MHEDFQYVGRVKEIYRFPVKSMRGESLEKAEIGWYGLDGDRRWAFVISGDTSHFPWLTGREVPELVLYTPRYADPSQTKTSPVVVTTPDGVEMELAGPELLDELTGRFGKAAYLIHLSKGCHDAMPLSFLSTATLEAFGQEAGLPLNPRRFRSNFIVELANGQPYDEDRWVGSTIRIGEAADAPRIQINRRNQRCVMTNIDPDTAQRDARVLKAVVNLRDECAAVYGSAEHPGMVRVGDPIYQSG